MSARYPLSAITTEAALAPRRASPVQSVSLERAARCRTCQGLDEHAALLRAQFRYRHTRLRNAQASRAPQRAREAFQRSIHLLRSFREGNAAARAPLERATDREGFAQHLHSVRCAHFGQRLRRVEVSRALASQRGTHRRVDSAGAALLRASGILARLQRTARVQ